MRVFVFAAAAIGIAVAGCTPLRSHTGYVVDADLVNSVQPGVDNRNSVRATLGSPSFAGQFGQGDWYYLSRDNKNFAYNLPHPTKQLTMRISFDAAGTVTAIRRSDETQIAKVDTYDKTTPTLGRKRGFFQDLFGNIGTVGAAGGPGAGASTGGGGRDAP